MGRCGVVILAAGGSLRLGEPKQLLHFKGEPLLARVARIALTSRADPVVAVLGACPERCAEAVQELPVRIVQNSDWREGIASSIRVGVTALLEEVEGIVLLLCDQPMITAKLINELIDASQGIAASTYGDAVGPPAFFAREYFDELLLLRGDHGAKRLLQRHASRLTTIPFPGGEFDVDTPHDWQRLIS